MFKYIVYFNKCISLIYNYITFITEFKYLNRIAFLQFVYMCKQNRKHCLFTDVKFSLFTFVIYLKIVTVYDSLRSAL